MMLWMLESTIAAGLLASLAWLISKRFPNQPGLIHLAWFAALARLVMPPLPIALPWGDVVRVSNDTWIAQPVPSSSPTLARSPNLGQVPGKQVPLAYQFETAPPATTRQSDFTAQHAVFQPEDSMVRSDEDLQRETETHRAASQSVIQPATLAKGAWNLDGQDPDSGATSSAVNLWLRANWSRLVWILWLVGSLAILIQLVRTMVASRRLWKRAEFADVALLNLVTTEAKRLGIEPPTVLKSENVPTPFVWCLGKLILVWPAHLRLDANNSAARQILIHELAHVKRRDHWFLRFELLAMLLVWWHPLFWVIRGRTRFYAELACDALVVHQQPKERKLYAAALIEALASLQPKTSQIGALALGQSNKSKFEKRLVVIMNQKTSVKKSSLALFAILLTGMALLPAVAPAPSAAPQSPAADALPARLDFLDRGIQEKIQTRAAVVLAKRYAHSEMWENAAETLAAIRLQDENDDSFWCLTGEVMAKLGRYDEALAAYERVAESEYFNSNAGMAIASIYAQKGDTARALAKLSSLLEAGDLNVHHLGDESWKPLENNPEFAQLTLKALQYKKQAQEVREAMKHKEYQRALGHLETLADMAPKSSWVWHKIGYAALAEGELQRGEHAIREAHRLDPNDSTHVYNLACVAALKGRTGEALSHLQQAFDMGFDNYRLIESDSDLDAVRSQPAFEKLLSTLRLEEELSEKLDDIDEDHDPARAKTLLESAFDLETLDDHDKRYLNHSLGLVSLKSGQYEAAIEYFTQELVYADHGRLKNATYNLGCAYARSGQTDKALRLLEAAVALGFHDADHIVHDHDFENLRGLTGFNDLARKAGRQRLLEKYHQVDWPTLERWITDGLAQNKFGRKDLSKLAKRLYNAAEWQLGARAYEQLAEKNGSDTAFYNAACCHALAGNHDQAFEWLDAAVQAGFDNWHHIHNDSDLEALKADARWAKYR